MFFLWYVLCANGSFADGISNNNVLFWILWPVSYILLIFILDSLIIFYIGNLIIRFNKINIDQISQSKFIVLTSTFRFIYTVACTIFIYMLYDFNFLRLYDELTNNYFGSVSAIIVKSLLIFSYVILFLFSIKIAFKINYKNKKIMLIMLLISLISAPWFIFVPLN